MKILACTLIAATFASLPSPAHASQGRRAPPPEQKDPAPQRKPEPARGAPRKAPTLSVGDAAPSLADVQWIKGGPASFERGRTYVVEFWATWCEPCIAGMPHVTELQTKHRDRGLTIVGVALPDPEDASAVSKYVSRMGDKIGYPIAYDPERKAFDAWMKAAGQNEIPCAFLIDKDGRIAGITDPTQAGFDRSVEALAGGSVDLKAETDRYRDRQEKIVRVEPMIAELDRARRAKEWPAAVRAIDQILAVDANQFSTYAANKFRILLQEMKQAEAAYAFGREAVGGFANGNAQTLTRIAWTIVDPDAGVERKDVELAWKAARRAQELTEGHDPSTLTALAQLNFLEGNARKAIELETQAVELSVDAQKGYYRRFLEQYKKAAGG